MAILYYASGFNEEDAFSGPFGERLKKDLKCTKQICFIPSYPDNIEKTEKWTRIFLDHFKTQNISFENSIYLSSQDTIKSCREKINASNFVMLLGGDPLQQIDFLKEKKIGIDLKKYNGIILGFSAGAMCMSNYILMPPIKESNFKWVTKKGLSLSNLSIFPHFNFNEEKIPESYFMKDSEIVVKDVYKLNEMDKNLYILQDTPKLGYIRVENEKVEIIGNGVYRVQNNKIKNLNTSTKEK